MGKNGSENRNRKKRKKKITGIKVQFKGAIPLQAIPLKYKKTNILN